MLSPKRDLITATLFLRLALSGGGLLPRVINVDGHPAYASAVAELKQTGELSHRCRCRTAPYLNNVIEQVCSAEIPSEPKPSCRNVLQRAILGVHARFSADPNRCTLLPNDLFGRG